MQGLDPWTQWVNIHTGKTAKNHKLFQIGRISEIKISTNMGRFIQKKNFKWNMGGNEF